MLTVDPAQRLKDALGLATLDGKPRRVPLGRRAVHLDAMLLDVKRTFDELVRRARVDARRRRARILENRLYQNLSGTLAGTAEYMAVEIGASASPRRASYDLVVVDTPPARHAVDFLDAPRRLLALLDSRAFAILKDPTSILPAAGSRLAHMRAHRRPARARALHRHGARARDRRLRRRIEDAHGRAARARPDGADALLRSDATSLVLVTAPEPRLIDGDRGARRRARGRSSSGSTASS